MINGRVVVYTFNPTTQETEPGGSLRPAWLTERVDTGHPGIHKETPFQNTHTQKKWQMFEINNNLNNHHGSSLDKNHI